MNCHKKIFLIRHGQTDLNRKKILQGGRVDIGLNETGKLQSEAFFDHYGEQPFDKVYTSLLKRSIESVSGFISKGIPHEALAELNEIDYGVMDGRIASEGKDSLYKKIVERWNSGETDLKPEGGESPEEVKFRLKKFIELIRSRKEENLILVSMHGRALRILLASIFHNDLKFMKLFPHQNLSLYCIQDSGSLFTIVKFNDTFHLKASNLSE